MVATITDWDLAPCVESRRPCGRHNRAIRHIENHLSAPPVAYGGGSVCGMRNSSSKIGGHFQTREETTSTLCCTVHSLNIIGIWLI